MSLYLQRLLERSAALPVPVVGAKPLPVTGSPIVAFDQRLASAEMAEDFSILGATPDFPEAAEEASFSARPPAPRNVPDAAPPPSLATAEPRAENSSPVPTPRPEGPPAPDAAAPEIRQGCRYS